MARSRTDCSRSALARRWASVLVTAMAGLGGALLVPIGAAEAHDPPIVFYVNGSTGDDSKLCLSATVTGGDAPCATIAAALSRATDGDTVRVAAGTYTERVTIANRVDLVGAGPGQTVLVGGGGGIQGPVITISGTGTATDTLRVAELTVQGALGSGNTGSGILVQGGANQSDVALEFITSQNNAGNGVSYNSAGLDMANMSILNSTMTGNTGSGIRVASSIAHLTGFSVTDSVVNYNYGAGFDFNPSYIPLVATGLAFDNVTFTQNAKNGLSNVHDVSILGLSGSLTMTDVDVVAANGPGTTHKGYGIAIGAKSAVPWQPAGAISLTNVTVVGQVGKGGLYLFRYSDLSNVTMTGVDLDGVIAPWGQLIAEHTGTSPLDIGNTSLATASVWGSGGMDATGTTFVKATDTSVTLDPTVPADAYLLADQVGDGVDKAGLGLIRFLPTQVVTTPNSFASPDTSAHLAYALAKATSGDTVLAKPGTYYEGTVGGDGSLTLTRSLDIGGGAVDGPLTVGAGTLSGGGTIDGPLTVGLAGTLAPGSSPGKIASGSYSQSGAYAVDLVGGSGAGYPIAGTHYDQLAVSGTVTLESTATLTVAFTGSLLSQATVYTIIDNDGTDPVVGNFHVSGGGGVVELAEGTVLTSGGQSLRLSYVGGDGNDVTLSVQNQTGFTLQASTPQKYGQTQTLTTTGGSGSGAVTYAESGTVCTITAGVVTLDAYSGDCVVTATKAASGAYLSATSTVTIVAQRRSVVVTADNKTIQPGAPAPTYTFTTSGDGFVNAEDFASGPTCTSTYTVGAPAGTYPITCAVTVDGTKYDLSTVAGVLTVAAPIITRSGGGSTTDGSLASAQLTRGTDSGLLHVQEEVIVDGTLRIPVTGSPHVWLLGRIGSNYLVKTATADLSRYAVEIVKPTGAGRQVQTFGPRTTVRPSTDGSQLVLTKALSAGTRFTVVDTRTGDLIRTRTFDAAGAQVADFGNKRLVISGIRGGQSYWWTPETDALDLILKRTGYADIQLNRFVALYPNPTVAGQSCQKTVRLSEPSVVLWRSCDDRPIAFSPDKSQMLTLPINSTGLGSQRIDLRSASGSLVHTYLAPSWFGFAVWESAGQVLLQPVDSQYASAVRCDALGTCQRASDLYGSAGGLQPLTTMRWSFAP